MKRLNQKIMYKIIRSFYNTHDVAAAWHVTVESARAWKYCILFVSILNICEYARDDYVHMYVHRRSDK